MWLSKFVRKMLGSGPRNMSCGPRFRFRPRVEFLEDRVVPAWEAWLSFEQAAFEITRTMPDPAMTWVDPTQVYTNLVPKNDRLEATVKVTFTFTPWTKTALRAGDVRMSVVAWFMEDDPVFNDVIGTTTASFTVFAYPDPEPIPDAYTRVLAPPSFVTSLAPNIGGIQEGDTAEFVSKVTGISPTSGPATGGTVVTVTGTNFGGASSVQFGNVAASSFSVVSPTQINATAPAHATGTLGHLGHLIFGPVYLHDAAKSVHQ